MSFLYLFLSITPRFKFRSDEFLFPLNLISVVLLVVGIITPAMVVVVSPHTSVFPYFILYYKTRSILGVILNLYQSSFWIVGVCLTVFSILIPLSKAGLTFFAMGTRSLATRLKIAKFLHAISKWSMADVFVAAILLANFAIRSDPSTQAKLFLGFYYFLGYCLLSMVITSLL